MRKKANGNGDDEEPLIENKHITMGLSTVITIAIGLITLTWTASMIWNNDKSHEAKQDLKEEYHSKRDSIYLTELKRNVDFLKRMHSLDSISDLGRDNKLNKMIPLLDTIIRGQKRGLNTTISLLRELYTNKEYTDTAQKKKIFCFLQNYLKNQL
jgi:hypothetical protein